MVQYCKTGGGRKTLDRAERVYVDLIVILVDTHRARVLAVFTIPPHSHEVPFAVVLFDNDVVCYFLQLLCIL